MYTPEVVAIHTKTKLHSISIIYRHEKIISPVCSSDFLLWQAVNQIKRNSVADPQQIPLENKVVNKIIHQ
jgi:hypothetical protein